MEKKNIKKKVALYGAGNVAGRKYFLFQNLFEVECCYDNNEKKWGGFIYSIPIKKWEKTFLYIIITTDFWQEIALQLEKEGLELGRDYLPYYIYDDLSYSSLYYLRKNFLNGKYLHKEMNYTVFLPRVKLAVIYGNCQTSILESALNLNSEFNERYTIIKTPKIWEYNYEPECIKFFLNDLSFWRAIDLFIYQFVRKENDFFKGLSSEYCLQKLNSYCQKVNILSLCFNGYFPQIEKNDSQDVIFAYKDRYVDELLRQKVESNEILRIINDDQFIPTEEIERIVMVSLSELKKRDLFADVKIYDYVEKNYKKEQLFFSPFHPCGKLLRKYFKRIFQYLGLKWDMTDGEFETMCCMDQMRKYDIPIYPSVIYRLGLKTYESRFYFNPNYISKGMILDFKHCIEVYIEFEQRRINNVPK